MSQAVHEALQRVDGPVLWIPAQKPASKGWQFKSLLHRHDGCPWVSGDRVAFNVALS